MKPSFFGRIALALTLLVGAGASLDAQAPLDARHKWWLSDKVRAEIGLTEPQSRELEAIFQVVVPDLKAQKQELDRAERELSTLLAEGAVDEAVIAQAIDRAEARRAVLNKSRTLMLFRMYRVLSPEQRVKLQSYHERSARTRRERSGEPVPR